MTELAAGITGLNLGIANVYLIQGKGTLSLVDTGAQHSPRALEKHLARRGQSWRDIDRIIVTHAHYDHAGGLAEIQAASGAEVWAHSLDSRSLRMGEQAPRPDPLSLSRWDRLVGQFLRGSQPPAAVQRELQAGERLTEVHGGAEVLHLPGHSPGHIGLWFPEHGVLLGGDVVTHFLPWRLSLPVAAYTANLSTAKHSIRKVAGMPVRTLGIGHGSALIGNAQTFLQRLVHRL
ncbi:MBL fold metallo-hydrolase [Deinococcus oregonensis]|uniref:MBL fold metallo-hydrolase n=1 Tax=Deinococcus oregonensis TaxID=1805970 RepID=A0ABV6AUW5_9DEIO